MDCRACETRSHCTAHGCIPFVTEEGGRQIEFAEPEVGTQAHASGLIATVVACLLAAVIAGLFVAGYCARGCS